MSKTFRVEADKRLAVITLALLNLSVIVFYALWFYANNWSANRSEAAGFDPSQLLPNGNLMWLVANTTVVLIVIFDILFALLLRTNKNATQI